MKKNRLRLSIFIVLAFVFCLTGCPEPPSSSDSPDLEIILDYTVTYSINGGIGTIPESQTVDIGSAVTLADGSTFQRDGYFFGGWNTSSSGTGTNYATGSSYTPTKNITLYALWIAPRIMTDDAHKEVTGLGRVKISLMTEPRYIYDETDEYRLYRSETQNGTYEQVATIDATAPLVLEDKNVGWTETTGSYFYKVAAVADGVEVMSTNGVKITMNSPTVYMQYHSYIPSVNLATYFGYCWVYLEKDGQYVEWKGSTQLAVPKYELRINSSPIPTGTYTLKTASSSNDSLTSRGTLTIRASHTYTIIATGVIAYESSFDKARWTFFTP